MWFEVFIFLGVIFVLLMFIMYLVLFGLLMVVVSRIGCSVLCGFLVWLWGMKFFLWLS